MNEKYFICRTTKHGVMWKKAKCLDTWSKDRASCWQFSKNGAKQIVDRYNASIPDSEKNQIHYNYCPVSKFN